MVAPGTPDSPTPSPAPPARPVQPTVPAATNEPVPPSATNEGSGQWPVQATNTIVNLVDQVRDKTTGPILTAARAAVFGLLAAILALIVALLLLIATVRLLDNAIPSGVWVAYLIIGLVFVVTGAFVFSRRNHVAATPTS